jgi:hypothetical protein
LMPFLRMATIASWLSRQVWHPHVADILESWYKECSYNQLDIYWGSIWSHAFLKLICESLLPPDMARTLLRNGLVFGYTILTKNVTGSLKSVGTPFR